MSSVPDEHRATAPGVIRCAVITVSDTRTQTTDTGGQAVVEILHLAGSPVVYREIVPDEPARLRPLLVQWSADPDVDAILLTGGTGISSRDHTVETVAGLLSKTLPGYGELFRMLSYQEIGPAAMLSGVVGGVIGQTVVLTMPGSPAGVRLAMEKLIVPELAHMVREARR